MRGLCQLSYPHDLVTSRATLPAPHPSMRSVTKWVHLNRGDEGLKALFASFHAALAPGGLLLLEPQPWRSYKKAGDKVRREAAPPGSYFHRQVEAAGAGRVGIERVGWTKGLGTCANECKGVRRTQRCTALATACEQPPACVRSAELRSAAHAIPSSFCSPPCAG